MVDLTYHAPSDDDFGPLLATASDWQVVRQLGRWKWPVCAQQLRGFYQPHHGAGFVWTVKHNGVWAGRVGVTGGALGYVVAPPLHGRGIATHACAAAIAHYFATSDGDTIVASTWIDNNASQHIMHKLGFVHWQTTYIRSIARGLPVLVRKNRLTRTDWQRLRACAK